MMNIHEQNTLHRDLKQKYKILNKFTLLSKKDSDLGKEKASALFTLNLKYIFNISVVIKTNSSLSPNFFSIKNGLI